MRGATSSTIFTLLFKLFQSTLPMRGATTDGDHMVTSDGISIHAPHAGSDLVKTAPMRIPFLFQSTLPMRGATLSSLQGFEPGLYFNPRSPCGERRRISCAVTVKKYFNPRSPCGERLFLFVQNFVLALFQSTLPMRGATNSY